MIKCLKLQKRPLNSKIRIVSTTKPTIVVNMTEMRAKSCIYLIGEPQQHFGGRVISTGVEVLKVFLSP